MRLNWEGNGDCVYKFSRRSQSERVLAARKGMGLRNLVLHKETLRDLTESDLAEVAGGVATTNCQGPTTVLTTTQSPACPSGATWLRECESYNATCG